MYTDYFDNKEGKSRKFSRNHVKQFSGEKIRYEKKPATLQMNIRAVSHVGHRREQLTNERFWKSKGCPKKCLKTFYWSQT